jgi:AcrR family transcriptional regulator
MGKRDTKDRVVDVAVRLFNESGTAAVSTNHIAEAAGVSPGNLYYHFRNKEEIIQEIWGRVDALWERSYALPSGGPPSVDDLRTMVEETFSGLWEYRFFYRELGALTRRDPELRERYLVVRERGLDGTEVLLRSFVETGVLRGLEGPHEIVRLAKVLMLVAECWLPYEETAGGVPGPEQAQEGVNLMMQVLKPHLADGATAGLPGRALGEGGR